MSEWLFSAKGLGESEVRHEFLTVGGGGSAPNVTLV